MEAKFNVSEVLSSSWETLKANALVLIGLFFGYNVVIFILGFVLGIIMYEFPGGSLIVQLISLAISAFFSLGFIKIILQALNGEEPQVSAFQEQLPKFITAILASLLTGLIVTIGLILLILPGLYLSIRLQFGLYFIVEENAGVIDSLKKSWELTSNNDLLVPLILLALAAIGLVIAGIICLGVGVLVAAPLVYVMQAKVYTILKA
jgi:membrane-anchored glycerophosphoryl diester phosphodiesterase (GDPDase)